MTPQEVSAIIMLARRAPLQNMMEAEAASQLLRKLAQHFAPVGNAPEGDTQAAQFAEPAPDE